MVTSPGALSASKISAEPQKRGLHRDDDALSVAGNAFIASIEPVIVDEPVPFSFDSSINRTHLTRFWKWVSRDVAPDIDMRFDGLIESGNAVDAAIEICLGSIVDGVKNALQAAEADSDANRRLTLQIGGEEVRARLDTIVLALKSRTLIDKARTFGKATASLAEDGALGIALQSLPLKDPPLASLLLHAIVGQTITPSRLITAASFVAGKATEDALRAAGFGPLGDAVLAHAQNQLALLGPTLIGTGDIDLACRSLDRYHRLIRSVGGFLELGRNSRWAQVIADLTKRASMRVEPRLKEIGGDIAQSMRRSREGHDRLDADRLLAALNGMYLLSTVREARENLALNALFDQIWNETGQSIEILVKRNLEEFRNDPTNPVVAQRLDGGIKMAEIRFSVEYAEVLKRARDMFTRRVGS